jgi:hypothetical protein
MSRVSDEKYRDGEPVALLADDLEARRAGVFESRKLRDTTVAW